MILGANGMAIRRVIIDLNDTCPAVVANESEEQTTVLVLFFFLDDDIIPQVKLRAVGVDKLAIKFGPTQ
jgi:hypothetical protein